MPAKRPTRARSTNGTCLSGARRWSRNYTPSRTHFTSSPSLNGKSDMNPPGHAALVTGGGSGLGAATADTLAAAGAKVTILDVNMDAAKAVAGKIGGLAIKCDVSDAEATQ